MFALSNATDVKVKNVITLSQKNRKPDEKPGVKLKLEMQLPPDTLEHFGAHLTEFVYEPPTETRGAQSEIEVVEPKKSVRLTQLGAKIAKLPLTFEMTGYTTEIVIGTGRKESNLLIKDCILSDWVLQFKEGGTVVAGCSLESPDVSKVMLGELGSLKSKTMPMRMTPPEVHQRDLADEAGTGDTDPDTPPPAAPRKPGAAERAAVTRVKGEAGPKVPHKGEERPARTERGKAATKAALAAGSSTAEMTKASDAAQEHIKKVAADLEKKDAAKADAATAAFAGSGASTTTH
ncbi:hypothetical protein [Piscinibacter defluvii]|uniref:hypothetical protein n=1 Tax=Piscinibacter defluvii TaxID=1796922 RepID=UPI000FDEB9C7|nr:hypothetical protein [Piscinibacter defluvii]